jgi:DNA polymerase-3 subunit delta'
MKAMARAPVADDIESLPEIDRLEGFPHPRETRALFGHGTAEAELATAISSGHMHHAWLIAGPAGIGKATLAYRAAIAVLADPGERDPFGGLNVDDHAIAARQVRALSHPELIVVRRLYNAKDKRFPQSIPVDEVRRLRSFLGHRAAAGSWRVVIVDSADELNVNAANALLKSLEEPPERTLFLIVTSEPGRLLPTIRSRCRTLACRALGDADLERAMAGAMTAAGLPVPSGEALATLLQLSKGSVRRLLILASGRGLDLYQNIYGLVAGLPDVNWGRVHQLADSLSGSGAEVQFELFFELLLDLAWRLVRSGATGEGAGDAGPLAARLAPLQRLATLAEVWETVAREKAETVALNLDRKTLILRTVSRLEAATR